MTPGLGGTGAGTPEPGDEGWMVITAGLLDMPPETPGVSDHPLC